MSSPPVPIPQPILDRLSHFYVPRLPCTAPRRPSTSVTPPINETVPKTFQFKLTLVHEALNTPYVRSYFAALKLSELSDNGAVGSRFIYGHRAAQKKELDLELGLTGVLLETYFGAVNECLLADDPRNDAHKSDNVPLGCRSYGLVGGDSSGTPDIDLCELRRLRLVFVEVKPDNVVPLGALQAMDNHVLAGATFNGHIVSLAWPTISEESAYDNDIERVLRQVSLSHSCPSTHTAQTQGLYPVREV